MTDRRKLVLFKRKNVIPVLCGGTHCFCECVL
jgi:hypothetical protein